MKISKAYETQGLQSENIRNRNIYNERKEKRVSGSMENSD